MGTLTIKITQGNKIATFTWNNDVTECNHVALGLSDADFDYIIANKGHEGATVHGWATKIDM